jgi:hypothetical protein
LDTSPATILALAHRVRTALLDDGFDGAVVGHGIDTLEETAFLADLIAGPPPHWAGSCSPAPPAAWTNPPAMALPLTPQYAA